MPLPPRVVLASDHAGFPLKEVVREHLLGKGVDVIDTVPLLVPDDDYPEIIREGSAASLEHGCPAIFFGGSGNGEAMAANKVRGIRCAVVYSPETALLARQHNDANAMSLGARLTDPKDAKNFVDLFLSTDFEGGRHERRVKDLEA